MRKKGVASRVGDRRQIAERTVRALGVVVAASFLELDPRMGSRHEYSTSNGMSDGRAPAWPLSRASSPRHLVDEADHRRQPPVRRQGAKIDTLDDRGPVGRTQRPGEAQIEPH